MWIQCEFWVERFLMAIHAQFGLAIRDRISTSECVFNPSRERLVGGFVASRAAVGALDIRQNLSVARRQITWFEYLSAIGRIENDQQATKRE